MRCLICESQNYSASCNLATEEYLFRVADRDGCVILYLWQNDNAVILGKNQNAYDEVDMEFATRCGISVHRRMTGGGAVYHDLGNLNYTLILPERCGKKEAMYQMLANVLRKLGVTVSVGGRNDVYMDGYKFSGNAFYTNGSCYPHHGTILVDSDLQRMNSVLGVSSGKLTRRCVKSVREKVKNIKEVLPDITIDKIKNGLVDEYQKWIRAVWEVSPEKMRIHETDIAQLIRKYSDPLWNLGDGKVYQCERSATYEWGEAKVVYNQQDGIVTEAKIYTDSLQIEKIEGAEKALIGKRGIDDGQDAGKRI